MKVKRVILVVERLTVRWKKRGWGGSIKNVCNENSIRSLICKLVKKIREEGLLVLPYNVKLSETVNLRRRKGARHGYTYTWNPSIQGLAVLRMEHSETLFETIN